MEVILLEKIANLGNLGDKVNVKSGYGRNFLLPQRKATAATAENIAAFELRRAELEKAADELPKYVAALKKHQLTMPLITTAINNIKTAMANAGYQPSQYDPTSACNNKLQGSRPGNIDDG